MGRNDLNLKHSLKTQTNAYTITARFPAAMRQIKFSMRDEFSAYLFGDADIQSMTAVPSARELLACPSPR